MYHIPNSITNLTKLIELDISYNNIKELPENIGNLVNIEIFKVNNNKIISIPESYNNLKKIKDRETIDEIMSSQKGKFESMFLDMLNRLGRS